MEDWRQKFVGREKDLDHLIEAWNEVKKGNPQLIVLLGESGLGKTRLIKEFYSWLNKKEDPGRYWPDLLEETENTLILNPKAEMFGEDARTVQIPWLWCGIRFPRPITHSGQGQETYGCGLLEFQSFLTPHLKPLYIARQKRDIRNELLKKMAETSADIFSIGTLPTIKNLYEIFTTGKKYIETRQCMSLKEDNERKIKDLSEELLSALGAVCDPSNTDIATVPVVFILDDAQYADRYTLKFTQEFYMGAFKNKWPCLFLITHWEREWNISINSPERKDNPSVFTDVIKNIKGYISKDWKPYQIGIVEDLSRVIKAAFPGITEEQTFLILKKAGGNPLLLAQIILWLSAEKRYFKEDNLINELTERALNIIKDKEFNLHRLFEERLSKIDEDMKNVLSFGSAQGMRFSHEITADLIKELGIRLNKEKDVLFKEAENPHSIISSLEGLNLKEFRQHIFYEIIRKKTSSIYDFEMLENKLMEIMIKYLDDGKTTDLKPVEEETFLNLLLSLIESAISKSKKTDRLNIYRLKAAAGLFRLYDSQYMFKHAYDMALKFANNYPEDGLSFSIVSYHMQKFIARKLLSFLNFKDLEIYWAKIYKNDLEEAELEGKEILYRFCDYLLFFGDIDKKKGLMDDAFEKYTESIEILRRIAREYGETLYNLIILSCFLNEASDIDEKQDRIDDALKKYTESMEICRRIVKEYEVTPDNLMLLSIVTDRLSSIMKIRGLDREILDL